MKFKSFLSIFPVSVLMLSCTTQQEQCNDNDLIPKEVKIKYEHNLVVPKESDVYKSFDNKAFVDKLIEIVLADKASVYDQLDTTKKLTKEEVNKIVGTWNDTLIGIDEKKVDTTLVVEQKTFNRDELVRILFVEKWYFNASRFVMTKDIDSWCPVRAYMKPIDSVQSEEIKKMLFWVKKDNSTFNKGKATLLKENISYEFNLTNENIPEWLRDFNQERFISLLLNKVLSDKAPAYDFFDQKKRLTNKEIRENLGETVKHYYVENKTTGNYDTVEVATKFFPEEITSVIFIEDWYIDWNTLQIFKKVKSIAPVRTFINYHDNGDEELEKKIPFIVHLN